MKSTENEIKNQHRAGEERQQKEKQRQQEL